MVKAIESQLLHENCSVDKIDEEVTSPNPNLLKTMNASAEQIALSPEPTNLLKTKMDSPYQLSIPGLD